jgi:hypothetical protein
MAGCAFPARTIDERGSGSTRPGEPGSIMVTWNIAAGPVLTVNKREEGS